MISRRKSRFALLCALTALLVAGSLSAGDKIQVNCNVYGNPQATPDSSNILGILKFKEVLEAKAGDKVQVNIYWDNKLASTYDAAVNGLQNGLIQLTELTVSNFAEFSKACVPITNAFIFPYPHYQIAHKVIDGKVGQMFRDRVIEETGIRIIGFWSAGFRHITSVSKPVTDLASLQGMKIRVQTNPIHLAAFQALGANPTPIAWGELFTALQQNVVDGAENPLSNIIVARLDEVQNYITMSGHTFEYVAYITSEDFYQSLPDDVKAAWDEAAEAGKKTYNDVTVQKDIEYLDYLKDGRMEVIELSPEELAKFREAVKPSYEETVKLVGKEYFDEILAEIAKVEKEYLDSIK